MRREANLTTLFQQYLRANPPRVTTWWECKQTTGDRIPFSSVKEHQRQWLLAVKHGHTSYKIPDDSRGVKPCDGITTVRSDAWVVLFYPTAWAILDIDDFLRAEKESKEKSITSEKALNIALKVIHR